MGHWLPPSPMKDSFPPSLRHNRPMPCSSPTAELSPSPSHTEGTTGHGLHPNPSEGFASSQPPWGRPAQSLHQHSCAEHCWMTSMHYCSAIQSSAGLHHGLSLLLPCWVVLAPEMQETAQNPALHRSYRSVTGGERGNVWLWITAQFPLWLGRMLYECSAQSLRKRSGGSGTVSPPDCRL